MQSTKNLLSQSLDQYRIGKYVQAAALCREVLKHDSEQITALHLLALVHKAEARNPEAQALFERVLQLAPDALDVRLNYAFFLKANGKCDAAKKHFQVVLALNPQVALSWQALGTMAMEEGSGSHARALHCFNRAVASEPGFAEAFYHRGLALRQLGRVDEAILSHRMAICKGLDGPGPYLALGNSLLDKGVEVEALAAFHMALAHSPASGESWYNLGNLRYACGDSEGALTAYRRSDQLGLQQARLRVIAMLVDLQRYEEAELLLKASLQLPGIAVGGGIELLHEILTAQSRQPEARALFAALANTPMAGQVYKAECLTALAALEAAKGGHASAAALLNGLESDNCWLFTTRSLAALRATLEQQGQTILRPVNHEVERPRIMSTTLGTRGRFAHNVLEYILLRLYAERYDLVLETPDWVGGLFFALDEPQQTGRLAPWLFARHSLNALVHGLGEPRHNRDILSPLFLFEYPAYWRDRVQQWLTPRKEWLPKIEPAVKALRRGGRTVVALHIRRGDFVQYGYPITRTDVYARWLRQVWPELHQPVLYLASDDLPSVCRDFAEFSPLTHVDVAPAWPDLEYLQDFHVLCQADVVGVSAASGFSQLAARLNQRAQMMVQPDLQRNEIVPFTPWSEH